MAACLLIASCGSGKMSDLEEYVEQVKAREPGPIEPLPEIKQVDTFVYEPGDRRNPFVLEGQAADAVPATAAAASGIAPDPLRRKEELEQYALDSLRMTGTLQQDDVIWGLILAPGGTLYRVRVGNYLGQNNGQITRISEGQIELIEIIPDGINNWRERQAAVALSQ
jgi:type IV pilus assembly protein PilP